MSIPASTSLITADGRTDCRMMIEEISPVPSRDGSVCALKSGCRIAPLSDFFLKTIGL